MGTSVMKELNSSFAEQSCIVRNYKLPVTLSKKHFSHSQQSISLTLKIIRNLGSNKVYRHDTISIRMAKICNDSVTLLTSLFIFHLISFSPHFFVDVSFFFLHSTVHLIHFIYHSPSHSQLPYLVSLILYRNSTWLSVSLDSYYRNSFFSLFDSWGE